MKYIPGIGIVLLYVALLAAFVVPGFAQTPTPDAGQHQGACFSVDGAEVAASGCNHDFRSGSGLIVQSGATETHGNYPSFTNGVSVAGPTTMATATPVLRANGLGLSNVIEADVAGTPVWYINAAGVESTGLPQAVTNYMSVAAPTAIATATPAMVVDSLGVSNLFEVRDAATPIFAINNGGAIVESGQMTNNSNMIVSAPTAIATAQPALVVDSLGVSRLFEVRDAATPVMGVSNGGRLWVGKGMYGTIGSVACTHGAALPDFSGNLIITITASGTPTPNDFTVGPAGTVVTLIGPPGSDTCTITKGAKMAISAATIVLGAFDTLTLVSDGTEWLQQSYFANATS
jgi:hypothetical protein